MGSRLVYDLATGLAREGFRAVRFDFRGVGRSEGEYGEGVGETEDALAVVDALAKESDGPPSLVGYSFGAAVALHAARQRKLARLVLVSCPAVVPESPLLPFKDARAAKVAARLVVGGKDPFCSPEEAARLAAAFRPAAPLTIIPRAGHFLEPTYNARAVGAVLEALR
jgi:alpha/beta superfamily hydrolase